MITFGMIGSGWRSEFFLRIAKALPEQFSVCGLVTRSDEKGVEIERLWGVRTFRTMEELLRKTVPGFVVVSVPGSVTPEVIIDAAGQGIPVLSETPPAYDVDKLAELYRKTKGAKIQVAEQYHLHPMLSSRIRIAQSGLLGELSEAQVSFSHGYHAVSLMRRLLGVGYENAVIHGLEYALQVIAGPDRKGPPQEERLVTSKHEFALLDFGGRLGVYDFIRDQHRSWIRTQRIIARGTRGEIYNNTVKYLKDFRTPVEFELIRKNAGEEGNMEGYHLKGILAENDWIYVNPFAPAGFSDDEIAVASCLVKMDEYVRGVCGQDGKSAWQDGTGAGQGFYSLAEASQDAYLALMIDRAMSTGTKVVTQTQPWAEEG